jgi:hypothetical protein
MRAQTPPSTVATIATIAERLDIREHSGVSSRKRLRLGTQRTANLLEKFLPSNFHDQASSYGGEK